MQESPIAAADAAAARVERNAAQYVRIRSAFDDSELAALRRLYELPQRHVGTSGGNTAAKLLLGLYNGTRFPFDLTDLRLFDRANLNDALAVIRMDAAFCRAEVHVVLDAIYADGRYTGHQLELWAWNLRLKGRCKKDAVADLQARVKGWA